MIHRAGFWWTTGMHNMQDTQYVSAIPKHYINNPSLRSLQHKIGKRIRLHCTSYWPTGRVLIISISYHVCLQRRHTVPCSYMHCADAPYPCIISTNTRLHIYILSTHPRVHARASQSYSMTRLLTLHQRERAIDHDSSTTPL